MAVFPESNAAIRPPQTAYCNPFYYCSWSAVVAAVLTAQCQTLILHTSQHFSSIHNIDAHTQRQWKYQHLKFSRALR